MAVIDLRPGKLSKKVATDGRSDVESRQFLYL